MNKEQKQLLLTCMEQKTMLMEQAMNLTKQLEVQSRQDVPAMDAPLKEREALFKRILKCDKMMNGALSGLPEDEISGWQALLHGQGSDVNCPEAERLAAEFRRLLARTDELGRAAMAALAKKKGTAQQQLADAAGSAKDRPLFYRS